MPRNVTITLSDGTSHVYRNVPDDVTPEQVTSRAQGEFSGRSVTAIDGGRKADAQAPAESGGFFDGLLGDKVSDKSLSDLVTGGKPKVMTREDAIKAKAQEQVAADTSRRQERLGSGFLGDVAEIGAAAGAGGANLFGIGPGIQAGISALKDGVPYGDALTYYREVNRLNRDKSIVGDIAGSLVTGGGALKAGGAALEGLTAVAPKIGNVLTKAVALEKGQKVRNAGKIVATGATTGAVQAAGEGKDIGGGAALGAATSALGTAALKAGVGTARYIDDRVGGALSDLLSGKGANASRKLRELIRDDPQAVADAQAALSQRTGSNEPLIAALNKPDTRRVTDELLQGSDEANDVAQRQSAGYIRNMMNRMTGHVNRAGAAADGAPALNATVDDLALLRKQTGDEIMAPIQNEVVDLTQIPLSDLERQAMRKIGVGHPEIAPKIKKAFGEDARPDGYSDIDPTNPADAGRTPVKGPVYITVRQADDLRQALDKASESAKNLPGQERHYSNASGTLGNFVRSEFPQYGEMLDTWAGHSRMLEGFKTTAAGKRISDIDNTNLSGNLRTTEGRIGMKAGELFRLREAANKSPASAINLARDLGEEGKLTRQASLDLGAAQPGTVTENIGGRAAADLADAARGQTEVVDKMLQAQKINVNATNEADNVLNNPETALYAAGVASGGTMVATKARLLARMIQALPQGINPKIAANVTEMLFSSNPAQTQQALNLLKRVGMSEKMVQSLLVPAVAGAQGGSQAGPAEPPTMIDVGSGQIIPNPDAAPEKAPGPQSNNEYETRRQDIIASQPPEFANLLDRMEQQESGGRADAVSSKGARNVMQVMPPTGPDAARYAGVPFDEELYKTDPEYGRLLGAAYMAWLLPQFDGDVAKALAAYNDGPADAKVYVDKPNWRSLAPDETQKYIKKILG